METYLPRYPKDPTKESPVNYAEQKSCIFCRIGTAFRTKEGLFKCSFCLKSFQSGYANYSIERSS